MVSLMKVDAFKHGYNCIPLIGKIPAFNWKLYQTRKATEGILAGYQSYGLVMGEISGGVLALDFDVKPAAEEFFRKHKEVIKTINVTRRGVHFLFRSKIRSAGKFEHGDIRGGGSYIVGPGSVVDGHTYWCPEGYELKPAEELCEFDPEWIASEVQNTLTRDSVSKVDAYLSKVESIEGQYGSKGLVRASAICRDAGLSESETLLRLIEWNNGPTVNPPWTHEELARAITRTFRRDSCSPRN